MPVDHPAPDSQAIGNLFLGQATDAVGNEDIAALRRQLFYRRLERGRIFVAIETVGEVGLHGGGIGCFLQFSEQSALEIAPLQPVDAQVGGRAHKKGFQRLLAEQSLWLLGQMDVDIVCNLGRTTIIEATASRRSANIVIVLDKRGIEQGLSKERCRSGGFCSVFEYRLHHLHTNM